jgi:hypothetical protein
MAKFDWGKSFSREGLLIFTTSDLAILNQIQDTYAERFVPFLANLAEQVGPNESGELIGQAHQAAQQVVRDLGLVKSGRVSGPTAKATVKRLADNMDFVEKKVELIKKSMKDDAVFVEQVAKAEKDAETKLEDLAELHRLARKRVAEIKPPGKLQNIAGLIRAGAPELMETVGGIGAGLGTAILGPYAHVAGIATRGIVGVAKGIRERSIAQKRGRLAGAVGRARGETPEEVVQDIQRAMAEGTPIGKYFGQGLTPGAAPGGIRVPREKRAPAARPVGVGAAVAGTLGEGIGFGGGGRPHMQVAAMPIWYFFDKLAHRAKWTRDMLMLQKKAAAGGKEGGLDISDMILSGGLLSRILPAIGAFIASPLGIGIIVAALLAAGGTILWKWGRGLAAKVFGKQEKELTLGERVAGALGRYMQAMTFGLFRGEMQARMMKEFVYVWNFWRDFFRELGPKIVEFGKGLVDWVKGIPAALGGAIQTIGDMGLAMINGIKGAFTATVGFFQDSFARLSSLGEMIGTGIHNAFSKVGELAQEVMGAIQGIAVQVIEKITGLVKAPFKAIGRGFSATKRAIGKMFSPGGAAELREDMKDTAQKVSEVVPQIVQKTVERVPMLAGAADLGEKIGVMSDRMMAQLHDMVGAIKGMQPKSTPVMKTPVDNVYNVRDPLLESLNSGGLGLED